MPDPLTQNCSQIALLPPDRRVWKSQAPHARHLNASFHQQKQELKKVEEKLKWQQHHEGSARDASAGRGRWLVGAGTGRQVAPGGTGTGQRQAPCSGGSAFLPASENLPKKFVAFPPVSTSILCQKCLCPGSAAGGRATHLPPRGGCGIPTFPINFGLFFFLFLFFLNLKNLPPLWALWARYSTSYLSTRKVVSVENLTGLFPSTRVTLVTCRTRGRVSSVPTPGRSQGQWQPSAFKLPERAFFSGKLEMGKGSLQ